MFYHLKDFLLQQIGTDEDTNSQSVHSETLEDTVQ